MFNIFKSKDVVGLASKGVDGIINGIDAAVYTNEEKAQIALKSAELKIKIIQATANENSDQSRTRRFTALAIIIYSIITITLTFILSLNWPEKAKLITKICNDWQLHWAFVSVIAFFFGNHVIGSFQKNKK